MELFDILWNNFFPLLFLVICGWFLDERFPVDIHTYNRLTIHIVLPCFIFYTMYLYDPSPTVFFIVPAFALLLFLQSAASSVVAKTTGIPFEKRTVFRAVSTYTNAGNLGVALMIMIFSHSPYLVGEETPYLDDARGTIILLLILMNTASNIFGGARIGAKKSIGIIKEIITMPTFYAVMLALIVKHAEIPLQETFLWPVLVHFSGAFVVLILITVGVQFHRARWKKPDRFLWIAAACKLIMHPFIAWALLSAFPMLTSVEAQIFFIYASMPTTFTLILYAVEYKNHPDLVTQTVLFSSACGIVTVTAAIYLSRILFPLG